MASAEDKRALHQRRLSRGFFTNGEGKTRGPLKGKSRPGKWPKGKSSKGGKGKGKTYQARDARGERRQVKGLVRLIKAQIFARAKCFTCGQPGHLARVSQRRGTRRTGPPKGVRQTQHKGEGQPQGREAFDFLLRGVSIRSSYTYTSLFTTLRSPIICGLQASTTHFSDPRKNAMPQIGPNTHSIGGK